MRQRFGSSWRTRGRRGHASQWHWSFGGAACLVAVMAWFGARGRRRMGWAKLGQRTRAMGPNGKVGRVSYTGQEASWAGALADFGVICFHFVDMYYAEGASALAVVDHLG
jgi:hypothetical protein